MKNLTRTILAFVILISFNKLSAQDPTILWQKSLGGSFGEEPYSIQQTTDGGFITAGYTGSTDGDVSGNHGSSDYWIVKLDMTGNLVWQKCLGGSETDQACDIKQTTDGGYIVAGVTLSADGDVSVSYGHGDYWIVKLDTVGNIAWEKTFGGAEGETPVSIQQTTDGGFIIAGFSNSNDGDVSGHHGSLVYTDYWIVKLDAIGNLVWQKSLGGSDYEYAYSIQQTTDGGFIITGVTNSDDGDISGYHGATDLWTVKLDSIGNITWQKSLGGK